MTDALRQGGALPWKNKFDIKKNLGGNMDKPTKDFFNMYGEGADQGAMMDGYIYARWIARYVAHLRKGIERKAVMPADDGGEAVDDLISLSVKKLMPQLLSRETSPYHGKVVPLAEAVKLISIDREVTLPALPETVIPYAKARSLILENPDHIAVIDCACRTSREGHCTPVDVCMIIGEPFAGFVLEHKVANARKLSRDEALKILKETDDRGWVHSAWFKESLDGRFYAICNCCTCCCMPMKGHLMSIPMIAPSGYRCAVGDDCNGCGECAEACPFGAITVGEKAAVDQGKCMGCGVCGQRCGIGALSLVKDASKGEPLDVEALVPA
jgi:ferredoxin